MGFMFQRFNGKDCAQDKQAWSFLGRATLMCMRLLSLLWLVAAGILIYFSTHKMGVARHLVMLKQQLVLAGITETYWHLPSYVIGCLMVIVLCCMLYSKVARQRCMPSALQGIVLTTLCLYGGALYLLEVLLPSGKAVFPFASFLCLLSCVSQAFALFLQWKYERSRLLF